MALRLAFCGSAEFSVPSLRACLDRGDDVVVVVTQPDRPGDRGRPAPRPVADAAHRLGIRLEQPPRLRDAEVVAALLGLHLDALVVAAYGQLIPVTLLDAVPLGGVNVHASLLPRWRGAAPVAAAILAGDAQTGVCTMRVEAGLDTGPVYAWRALPIPADATTPALTARLAAMGAELLSDTLARLEAGTAEATPQDEARATYAPRLRRADGLIDWTALSAVDVDRRVRALQPWPGSTAGLAGEEVRLLAGSVGEGDAGYAAPGTMLRTVDGSVEVATRAGVYRLARLQPPGRRAMDAAAWLRGRRLGLPAR